MSLFSERLKELRLSHGYTQAQLADLLNVNKQTISQYERGVRRPDIDTLLALCNIFSVSTDYLLATRVQESGSEHFDIAFSYNREIVPIIKKIKDISPDMLDRLNAYVDFLISYEKKEDKDGHR